MPIVTSADRDQLLALEVTPASWPIGVGRDFLGTDDLFANALLLFGSCRARVCQTVAITV